MRKSKANKTHLFEKEKRKIRKNYMVYSLWTGLWSSGAIFSPNKEPVHRLHGIRRDVLLSQRVKLGTEHRWSPFSALIRKKYLYQLVSVGDGYLYETIIYFLRQKIAGGFCNSFSVCKASSAVSAYRTSLSSLASWQVRSSKNVEESKYERLVITW